MKKLKLLAASFLINFSVAIAITPEYRTPVAIQDGPAHYPLIQDDEGVWSFSSWKAVYGKGAQRAYIESNTDTSSLSRLYFGKESFRVLEAFENEKIIFPPNTPNISDAIRKAIFFSTAVLNPKVEYDEKGIYCGFDVCRRFGDDSRWRVGLRGSLPFKVIEGKRKDLSNCAPDVSMSWEDLFKTRANEEVRDLEGNEHWVRNTFAYNLAGLTALQNLSDPDSGLAIQWGSGCSGSNDEKQTKIADKRISVSDPTWTYSTESKPSAVTLYAPHLPDSDIDKADLWADYAFTDSSAWLDKFGYPENTPDSARNGFHECSEYDYKNNLATDFNALHDLWLVPTVNGHIGSPTRKQNQVTSDSRHIQDRVNQLKGQYENYFKGNLECILKDLGVSFSDQRTLGFGDLKLEFYLGYNICCDLYDETVIGLSFPIGEEIDDPGNLWKYPLGNNGHLEFKAAKNWQFGFYDWMKGKLGFSYNYVFENTEKRMAAFEGASVRNIGPVVNADVRWGYWRANADLTFFHPEDEYLGALIGYDFYHKTKDKIHFNSPLIPDFFGHMAQLSSELMRENTDVTAHKVRGEIFKRWDYFEVFSGGAYTFAGKHCPRETDFYIGVNVYF